MRLRVVAVHVVEVVGRAQAQAEFFAEARQNTVDLGLPVDAMALHLEQEAVLAEDVAVRGHRLARAVDVTVDDPARSLTLQAAGQGDQSGRMLGQDLLVDAGLVVHPLHLTDGAQAHEVEVAVVVGGKEREVIRVAVDAPLAHEPRARRHVDLAADDRLDPGVLASFVKVDRAIHHAVVGHPDRRHLELRRPRDHGRDATCPIEQRVLGVVVEVDEGLWGVRHRLGWVWRTPRIV